MPALFSITNKITLISKVSEEENLSCKYIYVLIKQTLAKNIHTFILEKA